ncbi:MAG TPA: AAA family ATPase [Kofleriaceae bacterium]|nr:AAA family ATPase [Kofleriaceae bacterium]
MRILAIRGCNLASLAGEFEIDLARAPFSDAGVFAIVGNTGAGKSTLLDALCVALFDRTPRLTNHSRVVVGRGDDDPGALGAQDVRTLLRRGAASGWAEVDFESGDSRRYRARWSVRRARNQTDGTLQDVQLTLTAIDGGERLGGTKTETLKAIVARLGLSFDQFRRSALLAQGEFAAFLRADGKDRSELLERMTGTEIYSRLSVAAHVKATLAEQRLRDGRAAALAIAILDDDARVQAIGALAIAEQARAAARVRLAAAELAARWIAEAEQRARALASAEAEHAAAREAAHDAIAERQELVLRQRAERLRGVWDEAARVDRNLALARRDVLAADEAAKRAMAAQAQTAARRAELIALHEPIRAARIAAGLVERGGVALPVDGAAAAARPVLDDAAWLVERGRLAPEVAAWSDVDARFAQHAATLDAIAAIDRTLAGHDITRTQLAATRTLAASEHQTAVAKLADAQRKTQTYQQRRGLTLDAARRQEDEARTRLYDVERLVAIAAAARQAVKVRGEIERQLAELDDAAAADARQRAAVSARRETAATLRSERARVVDELRRAAGYEHARAELREGEACPLCGATEHPWRDRGALDEVIAGAQHALDQITSEHDATTTALATLAAREHQRERERARFETSRATAIASAAGAVPTWREHLASLGELLLVDDPASPAAEQLAAEREAIAKKRLEEARDVRRQTEAATKAAADAQADVQLAQAHVDQLAARLADVGRALADLEATAERLRGERAGRIERLGELAGSLEAAIASWIAALPAADASELDGRIAGATAGEASLARRKRTSAPPPVRRARAAVAGDPLCEPGWIAQLAGLERARAVLGELAVAWRTRCERVAQADATLVATLALIDRDARDHERIAAEHGARLAEAERRRDGLIAELATAAAALEAARAESGFDAEELRRLLAADPSRIDELVEQLRALDRAVERTSAVVSERRQLVDDHARTRPAELADASQVEALAAAVELADQQAARLAAALAADDDARQRRAAALDLVAASEASAEVDRILGAVIGSHDGKLFRSFAQSLTLDGLLAVANAHLEELAPRYQLERVPRHDLELQVIDRDLGAEVRSVQSLSGGESFLVSLALALGLSSMSAHDVRVRTLLIDEGFGTLDPATLDSALSVLDALQATGRQVGVISHVPALVERVGAHVRVVQRGGGRSEVIVA